MTIDGGAPQQSEIKHEHASARDLIDFYRRWPEYRQGALLLKNRSDLSAAERETVHWLVLLVDRISERDVGTAERA